ncbi:21510_t:CDS:2, partial [Cetraspora pellucida]
GSTFVKNLIKCNQEHKNICTPEMIKMLETEVDCNTLTTDGIYNSLFKNEYFNKLVKFNIDEINDIHAQIALRKQQIQNYCEIEFLIDDFSTNNRFENFMKGGIYEPFFWNSKPFSNDQKKIIENKWLENMNRLVKLEKNTNMIQYLDELLKISEALKHNQLFTPDSSKSTNISNDAKREFNKRRLKILGEKEVPEIPDPTPESSDNFNKLEKKIKNIKLSDISKLIDNNDIYQKIIDSKLPENDITTLQKLRKEQLNKLIENQYNELDNIINRSNDIDELNKLKSKINDSFLNESQKEKLEKNRLEKIENLKPIEKPETISFNDLKEKIENIKLTNTKELFDGNDLHQTITNSNLSQNDKENLEKLRNEKLNQLINEQYNKFNNLINILETEVELNNLNNEVINNILLPRDKKEIIANLIEDKINKSKGKEKLEKENNEKYDEIKQNIDKFLTPETLENYFKENINSIDENYLTNNRNKLSLNNFYNEKQNLLIEKLKETENQNYLDILTEIGNCEDSNLLTDKFYNDIYHKSLDILENILDKNKNIFKTLLEDFENDNISNLNDNFLSEDNFLQRKGDENLVEKNLDGWLKGDDLLPNQDKLKGYTLISKPEQKIKVAKIENSKFTGNINKITISGAEVIEKEAELDKSLAGTYLLPYVFNLIEFDIKALKNNDDDSYNSDNFAKIKDTTVKLKKGGELKLKIVDVDGPGILPILTGDGKTTKVVRCLLTCIFPRKHIILITPNEELAADAKNHHNTWLQYSNGISYKCVIYGKQGELPYIVKNKELASWNKLIGYDNDDKAHFPNTSYQVVQPLIIRMGYNTLLMSATFPKKNFSISTSKPREVYSITKFSNQTEWENEKTQIFFRTTANEYPRKINGEEDTDAEPILKSGLTPKKFKLLEESDIPFVIFDNTNSSAVSGITEGMPPGSLFIANINHEMEFSPDVDNVILIGETQLEKLGKGPGAKRWIYDEKDVQYLSVASIVQQIGRVGRLKKGKAFLTTQQLKELIPSDDIVFHLISGIMLPSSEEPMKKLNTLAVMIGVKGNPKPSSANQICPTYDNLPDPDVKDPNLWALHTE